MVSLTRGHLAQKIDKDQNIKLALGHKASCNLILCAKLWKSGGEKAAERIYDSLESGRICLFLQKRKTVSYFFVFINHAQSAVSS